MSLENLVKIGNVHPHEPRRDEIQKLLPGLDRSLADAKLEGLATRAASAGYDTLLRLATIALRAAGYRTNPEQPGIMPSRFRPSRLPWGPAPT